MPSWQSLRLRANTPQSIPSFQHDIQWSRTQDRDVRCPLAPRTCSMWFWKRPAGEGTADHWMERGFFSRVIDSPMSSTHKDCNVATCHNIPEFAKHVPRHAAFKLNAFSTCLRVLSSYLATCDHGEQHRWAGCPVPQVHHNPSAKSSDLLQCDQAGHLRPNCCVALPAAADDVPVHPRQGWRYVCHWGPLSQVRLFWAQGLLGCFSPEGIRPLAHHAGLGDDPRSGQFWVGILIPSQRVTFLIWVGSKRGLELLRPVIQGHKSCFLGQGLKWKGGFPLLPKQRDPSQIDWCGGINMCIWSMISTKTAWEIVAKGM